MKAAFAFTSRSPLAAAAGFAVYLALASTAALAEDPGFCAVYTRMKCQGECTPGIPKADTYFVRCSDNVETPTGGHDCGGVWCNWNNRAAQCACMYAADMGNDENCNGCIGDGLKFSGLPDNDCNCKKSCSSSSCNSPPTAPDCTPIGAHAETKDGRDNDCDGYIDEDIAREQCSGQDCPGTPICGGASGNGLTSSSGIGSDNSPACCEQSSAPVLAGDPFSLGLGESYFRSEDAVLRTGAANLAFTRYYVSADSDWAQDRVVGYPGGVGKLPTPFGRTGSDTSLRWSHNFFTFVSEQANELIWRGPTGESFRFARCTTTGCRATPKLGEGSVRAQLKKLSTGYDGYEVTLPDGMRLVYSQLETSVYRSYFITQGLSATGAVIFSTEYADPVDSNSDSLACPHAAGSNTGVPYLKRLIAGTGGGAELLFTYLDLNGQAGPTECALSKVTVKDSAGTETDVASYEYFGWTAGFLAQANVAGQPIDVYSYTGGLTVTKGGIEYVNQTYSSGAVATENNLSQNLTINNPATPSCTSCCTGAVTKAFDVVDTDAQAGEGSGSATLTKTYKVSTNSAQHRQPRIYEVTDACSHASVAARNVCSAGTEQWEWQCASGSTPGYERAHKDKNNNWTVWDKASSTSNADVLELTRERKGATSSAGANALSDTSFTYEYGAGNKQMLKTRTVASGYVTSTNVVTTYSNDTTKNRVKAEITCGKTQTFNTTTKAFDAQQSKCRGVFYFDYRKRSGENPVSNADPFGRTLETHGPCWVADATASDCPSTGSDPAYPVTQSEYYLSTEGSNKANRLKAVRRYPNAAAATSGSLGTALEVLYTAYDAEGRVTEEKDENLVVTRRVYTDGQLSQLITNYGGTTTRTTSFAYDNGRLTARTNPDGSVDVFCYRLNSTSGGCSSSNGWTPQLQWQAKASSSTGTTWSDRILYEYWPDGTVKKETYEVTYSGGSTETRKVLQFAADAQRRPTMKKTGETTGAFTEWSGYDLADNRKALGNAYSAAPSFCDDGAGGISKRCAAMNYDGLNRIAELIQRANTSPFTTPVRSCLSYDKRGNVVKVQSCQVGSPTGGAACDSNFTSGCTGMAAEYVFDDFGNLVQAKLPNTGNSTAKGTINFGVDAAGNVTSKQTPEQLRTAADGTLPAKTAAEWTEFTFDQLGRGLDSWGKTSTTSTMLWKREYDASTAHSTCGATTGQKARLAREWNARGMVVYTYNPWGEVTAESRYRQDPGAGNPCSTTGVDAKPSTSYTFDNSTGRLTGIDYPHGRHVGFGYYTGAERAHQIKNVDVTLTSGSVTLIDNARWAQGELVAYQFKAPSSQTYGTVEYLLGDASSGTGYLTRPTATSNDKTGRVRGILVSQSPTTPTWTGTGDIFHRTYKWNADQVAEHKSQFLGSSTNVFLQTFDSTSMSGYDQLERLQNAEAISGVSGGPYPYSLRRYGFDGRGNVNSELIDGCGGGTSFSYDSAPHRSDRLLSRTGCNTNLVWYYDYDHDGRVVTRRGKTDSSGSSSQEVKFGFSATSTSGGDSSVYKTATVRGMTWTYHYDPRSRRIFKTSPTAGIEDEFFYLGDQNQLLEDRGNYDAASKFGGAGAGAPIDEYIWLGGKPVAFIRSKFNSSWARQTDLSGDCQRNGEAMSCGVYFIVTDHIGFPALLVDSNRRIAQAIQSEPRGYANRIHWYGAYTNYATLQNYAFSTIGFQAGTGMSAKARAQFNMLDTETTKKVCGGCLCGTQFSDYVALTDGSDATQFFPQYGGYHSARKWTDWAGAPASGTLQLRLVSDDRNCPVNTCWSSTCSPNPTYAGAAIDGWEYRRWETNANPAWTPLRYPGQYHDEETDLDENWNRYYDPLVGRYLQIEPKMIDTKPVARERALEGRGVAAYSYGATNPLARTDSDGRWDEGLGCTNLPTAADVLQRANVITDECLRRCVVSQAALVSVSCITWEHKKKCQEHNAGGYTDENKQVMPGAQPGGPPFLNRDSDKRVLDTVYWCNRPCGAEFAIDAMVHELAHTCGWNHAQLSSDDTKGVPGGFGGLVCDPDE